MGFLTERNQASRVRAGLAVLVIGTLLVLWAWGNWLYRTTKLSEAGRNARAVRVDTPSPDVEPGRPRRTRPGNAAVTEEAGEPEKNPALVRLAAAVLSVGALLILVYLFGSYAIIRSARRLRAKLREPEAPGADLPPDAWSMHRAPELEDADDEGVEYDEGADSAGGGTEAAPPTDGAFGDGLAADDDADDDPPDDDPPDDDPPDDDRS